MPPPHVPATVATDRWALLRGAACGSVVGEVASHPPGRRPLVQASPATAGLDDCVRVFEQDFDYVFRTLQRFGATRADAEDLAQEVFLVMLRRRRDWDPGKPLRPWLVSIAFRVALAHRRRRAREVLGGLIDARDAAPLPEEKLASASARQLVLDALAALPPRQRVVFMLRELDGLPMKQIASSLELPLFTAYSRLRAARTSFAREVRRRSLGHRRTGLAAVLPLGLLNREAPVADTPPGLAQAVLGRVAALGDTLALSTAERPLVSSAGAGGGSWVAVAALATLLLAGLAMTRVYADAPADIASPSATASPFAAGSVSRLALRTTAPARTWPPARLMAATRPSEVAPDRAAALGRGLVAYWRFDEAPGATAIGDLSGHGSECLPRRRDSLDWIDGPLGRALRLRGGGWLECPATRGLQGITTELTISAWVLRGKDQPHLRTIVSRQHGTGRDDDFYLAFVDGDALLFASRIWHRVRAPIPRALQTWFHVAAVRSASGTLRLYVDGVEVGQVRTRPNRRGGTLAGTPYANPILVGAANNAADPRVVDQKLNGGVDELLIYDRALPPEEIVALAAGTQPRL
jgi:RNA polymerase sigma-70 factor (ECF subfamily)